MRNKLIKHRGMSVTLPHKIAICVASVCCLGPALASPQAPTVAHGSANFIQQGSHLQIESADRTIINWQDFSIAQNESVHFLQTHASSATLNRVIGHLPSDILGELTSNGRVFLINPNGLIIGQNATIDTAGFVASTLDIQDQDFLAGHLAFAGDNGAIENRGYITAAPGGEIVLIAPDIQNHGVIEADDGSILLAAGREVVLHSTQQGGLSYKVSAPSDRALNVGELVANNGSVKVFADRIFQQGVVSANRVTKDADGTIVLEADSRLSVSGELSATGDQQQGGDIHLLANQINVADAIVDASGDDGGEILIGGGQQGLDPNIANSSTVYVSANAMVSSDGVHSGDGGRVIVFAEESTIIAGDLSARGGRESGDGGFVETSGLRTLRVESAPDISADNGEGGTWLIDPYNITIDDFERSGNTNVIGDVDPWNVTTTGPDALIDISLLETALNADGNIIISTTSTNTSASTAQQVNVAAPTQEGNITFNGALFNNNPNSSLTLNADNNIVVNGVINNQGGINLNADNDIDIMGEVVSRNADINLSADHDMSGAGSITIRSTDGLGGTRVSTNNGAINLTGNGISIVGNGCGGSCFGGVDIVADNINFGTPQNKINGDISIQANADVLDANINAGGSVDIFAFDELNIHTTGNLLLNTADTGSSTTQIFNTINLLSNGAQTIQAKDISAVSGIGPNSDIVIAARDEPFDNLSAPTQTLLADNLLVNASGGPSNTDLGARVLIVSDGAQMINIERDLSLTGQYTGSAPQDPWSVFNASIVANNTTDINVGRNLTLNSGEIILNSGVVFGEGGPMQNPPVNANSRIVVDNLISSNGLISNQRDPEIDNSELTLTTMGAGSLINGANTNLMMPANYALLLESVNWDQQGTVEWRNGDLIISNSSVGEQSLPGRNSTVSNSGTLRLNSEDGDVIFFNNDESLGAITNTGTVIKDTGNGVTSFGVELNNQNQVIAESGEIAFLNGGLNQTAGETILRGGNISHDGMGSGFIFTGGSIVGGVSEASNITTGGSLIGDTTITNTIVAPGFSAGVLTFDGNLDASGGGNVVEIEVTQAADASSPGLGWDQVLITGNSLIPDTNRVDVFADFEFNDPVNNTNRVQDYPILMAANGTLDVLPATFNALPSDVTPDILVSNNGMTLGLQFTRSNVAIEPEPPVTPQPEPPMNEPEPPMNEPPVFEMNPPMLPIVMMPAEGRRMRAPIEIVDVLVTLKDQDRRAHRKSKRVRQKLNAVNMCVGTL